MLWQNSSGESIEKSENELFIKDNDGVIFTLPLENVLTAEIEEGIRLKISFTDLKEDYLKVKTFIQDAQDVEIMHKMLLSLKESLKKFETRPKHLLVFVNPGCGHYTGEALYSEEVAPVFSLCGISTEVVVTKAFGEGRQDLLTRELKGVDGIVVVGGDGTFANIAQGLLERTQRDEGLELRNKKGDNESTSFHNLSGAKFHTNSIPIGAVPGGSGNGFAATTAGIHDARSNAILIALGRINYADITAMAELDDSNVMDASVDPSEILPSIPSKFRDFSVLMGLVANTSMEELFKLDNELRKKWGPMRYFLFPFYLKSEGDLALRVRYVDRGDLCRDRRLCRSDCASCDHSNPETRQLPPGKAWKDSILVNRDNIHFVLNQCRYRYGPKFGIFPSFHSADGLLYIVGLGGMPLLKGFLHHFNWLPNDFYISDSSPFELASDEVLVESDVKKPLYASLEESSFDVHGTLHFKVFRKLLKTYGSGLRDADALPQRASTSVSRFLLKKLLKWVVISGAIGATVVVLKGKWKSLLPMMAIGNPSWIPTKFIKIES